MKKYKYWTRQARTTLDRLPHEPTPEEIKAKCLEIQKTWSPRVRQLRRVINNKSPKIAEVNGIWIATEILLEQEQQPSNWMPASSK